MDVKAYDNIHGPHLSDIETPPCPRCGQNGWVTVTTEQLDALLEGTPIQDALPDTPAPEREQIRTGHHPACWQTLFG